MTYGAQHVFLIIAIVVGIGTVMELAIVVLVRHEYRTTHQQWPHAKRIWTWFAIGTTGMLGGALCAILPPLLTGTWPHHPSLLYDDPLLTILSVGGIGTIIVTSVLLAVAICMADVARLRVAGQQSHRLTMRQRDGTARSNRYNLRGKALFCSEMLSLALFSVLVVITANIIAALILSSIIFLMSYVVAMITLHRSLPAAGETLPS